MHRSATADVTACYAAWSERYFDDYYGPAAPYPPVHVKLIVDALKSRHAETVLDAGCGPASILRTLVREGFDCWGFDLTAEMVNEARIELSALKQSAERIWQGDAADALSYRRAGAGAPTHFDAVLAIGVLPHLQPRQIDLMFAHLFSAVCSGGTVIMQARNALFSLFTFNRSTHALLRDDVLKVGSIAEERQRAFADECLAQVAEHLRMDLPVQRSGTAYDDTQPRAENPLTLPARLAAHGFRDVETLFYHYHALPPMCESSDPETFRAMSLAREDARDWRGHILASSFLLVGRRP